MSEALRVPKPGHDDKHHEWEVLLKEYAQLRNDYREMQVLCDGPWGAGGRGGGGGSAVACRGQGNAWGFQRFA